MRADSVHVQKEANTSSDLQFLQRTWPTHDETRHNFLPVVHSVRLLRCLSKGGGCRLKCLSRLGLSVWCRQILGKRNQEVDGRSTVMIFLGGTVRLNSGFSVNRVKSFRCSAHAHQCWITPVTHKEPFLIFFKCTLEDFCGRIWYFKLELEGI